MHYIMSDIHGCYEEYMTALDKINFSDEDTLYVLGDCIDRGYASIKVLQDMMKRSNVFPIVGNHEFIAMHILKKLCMEIIDENVETQLSVEDMEGISAWVADGGDKTMEEFSKLTRDEQVDIMDYIGEFSLYEELDLEGKSYLMIHGGLEPFAPELSIDDYDIMQILCSRVDYNHKYFDDRYTITGHTPTILEEGNEGRIIRKNNHIAVDCGCVYGYNLAVFCLETEEEFYIPLIMI